MKPTVIYIMSDRRSGSTLLENILSKSRETVSVGELAMLKGHVLKTGWGERWNWTCACGEPVQQCVFWKPVLDKVYANDFEFETNIRWNLNSKLVNAVCYLPAVFKKSLRKLINTKHNKKAVATLQNLYKAIGEVSGKKFIIDSSKDPVQALAVYEQTGVDVKVIWLKRDLRAIATSKNKWKLLNKKKEKSLLHHLYNVYYFKRVCKAVATLVKPNDLLELNYEELALNTADTLEKITTKFNLQPYEAPLFMELNNDHTIGGTPERFEKKPIAYDASWKQLYNNKRLLYVTGSLLNKL